MLEALLLVKLATAKSMWETPPYYTNDAQDVINQAIAMSVETEWEDRITMVLNPEFRASFEQLKAGFLADHPQYSDGDTTDHTSPANREFHQVCQDNDKQYNDHVLMCLGGLIDQIIWSIGDKIHRRNLQIADLKREPGRIGAIITRAASGLNRLLIDIDSKNLEMFQVKEHIGKTIQALLK